MMGLRSISISGVMALTIVGCGVRDVGSAPIETTHPAIPSSVIASTTTTVDPVESVVHLATSATRSLASGSLEILDRALYGEKVSDLFSWLGSTPIADLECRSLDDVDVVTGGRLVECNFSYLAASDGSTHVSLRPVTVVYSIGLGRVLSATVISDDPD